MANVRRAGSDMILVAVSLDPHAVQEADFELPLWEFGLHDQGALDATDLMRGDRFTWQGKSQHIRLDPADCRLPSGRYRNREVGDDGLLRK